MKAIYKLPIDTEKDLVNAREAASNLAEDMGFDQLAVNEIKLAVSEISQNAFRHAEHGNIALYSLKNDKVFRVVISDKGEGIKNIALAMREGFTTIRTSLGLGLEAAQRLMDKFDIKSIKEEGTVVTMEKYLPMTVDQVEYGVVCVPDEDYNFNGDDFIIREFDGDKVLLGVIDGIGQGYDAHAITCLIKKFVLNNFYLSLEDLIHSCHHLLKESELTGGAAVSLAMISPHLITYLGVGDTHSYIMNTDIKELSNYEGRVGEYQLPNIQSKEIPIEKNSAFIMCTDGISTKILENKLTLQFRAQQIANKLFNEYHKAHGDVTVLVTKIKYE